VAILRAVAVLGTSSRRHDAEDKEASMIRMFVHHHVNNFSAWKKVYDEFDPKRRTMGVTGHAVYQTAGDDNDVTVSHDFKSLDEAKRFATSEDLKAAMSRGGVAGKPDIWFTNPI
jgi:hypothetical protein